MILPKTPLLLFVWILEESHVFVYIVIAVATEVILTPCKGLTSLTRKECYVISPGYNSN